jgi:asparagine synthase (glutamine-hydrolysing)
MTDPHPRSNQPMQDIESKNCIVYNGEIYNFKILRNKLEQNGYKFKTQSDTEVILKSLQIIGLDSIKSFEGMFAFAFYNHSKKSIVLARDYLGKKPLYYSLGRDFLIFSSQINVIKNYLNILNLDYESISTFLRLGYLISPQTMYVEIKSINPGEFMEINLNNLKITTQEFFTPSSIKNHIYLKTRSALKSAILERVEGHDRVALSMSGGIDSTLIALETKNLNLNCTAYTMKWSESDKPYYNKDVESAELITNKLGINFKAVEMPKINRLDDQIDNYLKAMGEPNSNPNGISMMALYSKIAEDGFRLTLTGDGADEIFGGYKRYTTIQSLEKFPTFQSKFINEFFRFIISRNSSLNKAGLVFSPTSTLEYWLRWHELSNSKYLKRLFKSYYFNDFELITDSLSDFLQAEGGKVGPVMFRDLKTWLISESNTKLDRISMHYSIEARSPFQSEKLIGTGYNEMSKSKFALNKKILIDNYPEINTLPILTNKTGFLSPLGYWLRSNKNLILGNLEFLSQYLPFDKKELQEISKSPERGDYKKFRVLWNLIILSSWYRLEKVNN